MKTRCDVRGCSAQALWCPALVWPGSRNWPYGEAQIGLHFCEAHKERMLSKGFFRDVAPQIIEVLRKNGISEPERIHVEIRPYLGYEE